MSCFPDPSQPGLDSEIKSECGHPDAIMSEQNCLATNRYCKWLNDSPNWFRKIMNEKERDQYKEWKKEQKDMKEEQGATEGFKRIMSYAAPGNPIWSTVISSPDR